MDKYPVFVEYQKKVSKSIKYKEVVCLHKLVKPQVKNDIELQLIKSLVDEKIFRPCITVDRFCYYLLILSQMNKTEDLEDIVEEILGLTQDEAQINTIKRVFEKKGYMVDTSASDSVREKVEKECPHCNNKYIDYDDTSYTICGYSSRGYDWKGCGCDWCFTCGKKLCKRWDHHELYNKLNRFHDRRCCKLHAYSTNSIYPNDYCQCSNFYVRRN